MRALFETAAGLSDASRPRQRTATLEPPDALLAASFMHLSRASR